MTPAVEKPSSSAKAMVKLPGAPAGPSAGPGGERRELPALHELEFTSARKRMSMVVRLKDEIWCITKGADNILERLLAEPLSLACKEHLKTFSQQGLRTLLIAAKRVDESEYEAWRAEYKAASNAIDGSREEAMGRVAAELEQGLSFVGVTAVEDRLQEGVPEAIATLKEAGVRLWVLTGDKRETAVDIAHSCNLFTPNTTIAYAVDAEDEEEALEMLRAARKLLKKADAGGLVLDGKTLHHALHLEDCRSLIYQLGIASRSCVCCRLSPMQKRHLVDLVRERDPDAITMAIGDGANDVPMIEGAHVGVGVRGREGASAVQVSDVAISQFRFLVPLLLCHGRRSYRRVSFFLCYYLYKNVVLAMGDIIWMHQNGFRRGIAFPEYLSINYNVFFTSWHIIVVLGFDLDVPDEVACRHPELYLVGPNRELFNRKVFWRWMAYALLHGSAAWLLPNLWFGGSDYNAEEPVIFWRGSAAAFSIMVLTVDLKLILCAISPLKATTLLPSLASVASYLVVLFCLGHVPLGNSLQPSMTGVPAEMFSDVRALVCVLGAPLACLLPDALEQLLRWLVFPAAVQRLRARAR
mmetsp:Transcript_37661/g.107584  ORF Transcript_37661/g.107584 Transcript_37661/m.107584 type:complete len:582 (+) Transcript_37661:141-1886(+)